MFWRKNIESQLHLQVFNAGYIERYMEDATFRFHETKKDDPIMAATNLFENSINIHPFEDGNGRIFRLILAHVLIQRRCCLFSVTLSCFHRRGRRHYIRAVKMLDRKPPMLYNMIVKSLIHFWDNFEQNTKILARCLRIHHRWAPAHGPGMTPGLGSKKLQIALKCLKDQSRLLSFQYHLTKMFSASPWLKCCMEKYQGARKNHVTPYMV